MKTEIFNLYAGPGAGKSTTAAMIFADLKARDISCELVTEYAKDLTWDAAWNFLNDQIYVFAEQHHRIYRLLGKVRFIIVDSPLLLSVVYDERWGKTLRELVMECYKRMNNHNYYVNRYKAYQTVGRNQTKQQAIEKDREVRDILDFTEVPYRVIPGTAEGARIVVEDILQIIREET